MDFIFSLVYLIYTPVKWGARNAIDDPVGYFYEMEGEKLLAERNKKDGWETLP